MAQRSHAPLPDAHAREDEPNAQTDFGWDHIRAAARVSPTDPLAANEPLPDAPEGLDAIGQQMRLKEAYPTSERQGPATTGAGAATAKKTAAVGGRVLPRMLTTALGCLIVALAGFVPIHKYLQLASTEAIVTTHVITVRTPIDGQIDQLIKIPEVGSPVKTGAVLLRITNRRADRGPVDAPRRIIELA